MTSRLCASRADIVKYLKEKHGETSIGMGLRVPSGITELWVNEKTETWSITVTYPSGQTCIVGLGNHWQETFKPKKGEAQWQKSQRRR